MADTTALKNRIRAAVKANDNQEITGPVLQQALLDMVDELNGATETEATQRQSSDSTLQQNINNENLRALSAESNIRNQYGARFIISSATHNTIFANFNTTDGTLTFPSDSWVFVSKNDTRYALPTTPVSYMINVTSVVILVFNYSTGTLSFKTSDYNFTEYDLLLAVVRKHYSTTNKSIYEVIGCFNYTVDGNPFNKLQQSILSTLNNAITNEAQQRQGSDNTLQQNINNENLRALSAESNIRSQYGARFIISSATHNTIFANFNTTDGTLTFPSDSWVFVSKNDTRYALPTTPVSYMINVTSVVILVFNYSTGVLSFQLSEYSFTEHDLLLAVVRKDYSTVNKSIHEVIGCFNYTVDGNPFNKLQQNALSDIAKNNTHSYYGEVLPINNCRVKTAFSLSDFGTATYAVDSQGMDVYDDKYLFQGNQSETRSIYILDLEQKTILGNFLFEETGNWHMNNLNCAEKEDESDKFPLIYLSECYGQRRCAVIKINDTADGYTIKQMITFNTSSHYGGGTYAQDWFIDLDNNLLYCYGNTAQRGRVEIVKFNLPDLTNSEVTLTDADVLDSFFVDGIGIYQGSKIINSRLVCPEGFGNSQWPAYISVIDLNKKQIVTKLPWNYGEPEAAALYNGGLLIVNNSTSPTYKLVTI